MDSIIHPSTRIKATYSDILDGKKIALGITGSVAAFLSPEIARELMRHGADVIPIMSEEGEKMVGKNLMWWATGNEPITNVTGELEHISLAGVMNKPVDLMLIAPCTTNTVAKLAAGIADTPVTLIASSLNGKKIPIMVLNVAHIDLINSPAVQESLDKLRNWGLNIIEPIISEGKAKVPKTEDIIFEVMEILVEKKLENKTAVVTAGPTREYIDNVRFISNSSSGRMGIEIARHLHLSGAFTQLILGPSNLDPPRNLRSRSAVSTQDIVDKTIEFLEEHPNSIVVLASAMADFTPEDRTEGKIKSGQNLDLLLEPTTKLSDLIKVKYPDSTLVLFKAEWNVSLDDLVESAKNKLQKCNADYIIANDLSKPGAGFETETNKIILMDKSGKYSEISDTKTNIARNLIQNLSNI